MTKSIRRSYFGEPMYGTLWYIFAISVVVICWFVGAIIYFTQTSKKKLYKKHNSGLGFKEILRLSGQFYIEI